MLEPVVVDSFIARGLGLFLLDGLDEVPETLRGSLLEIIASFRLKNKNNCFLLTGRPHGIDTSAINHSVHSSGTSNL